jgi:hypothetical protein
MSRNHEAGPDWSQSGGISRERRRKAGGVIRGPGISSQSTGARISLFDELRHSQVEPYIHGLVRTEVLPYRQPKKGQWTNVSITGP